MNEQAAMLQLIADNMLDLVSLTDPQGNFTYVGKSHEILGYPLETFIGTNLLDYVHPDDVEAATEAFREFLQEQENERWVQYRIRCQDGSCLWLETKGKMVKDDEGQVSQLVFSSRDITQHKAAEKALADSKNLLDSVFHSIQDGITVLNADLTIRETNHTLKKLYSVHGSVVGQKCHVVSRKRSEPCKICPAIQALESQKACSAVVPLEQEGQEKGWLEIFAYPFVDQSTGQVDGVVEFVRNITEQREREEQLRKQNGLISALLDAIPDLVFYKDVDGMFLGCNQAFSQQMGLSPEHMIGKTDYELHPKELADFFRHHDLKALTSRKVHRNEEWVTYPDGRSVLLDTLKTPYHDYEGNLIGILGIGRDITQRKESEEQLQELNQLLEGKNMDLKGAVHQAEAASEAKSRYLAHMNHELRTPLNGFMGFVQLMDDTRLDDEQQMFMYHMKQSANHMLSIINNVLDHAKIEAGEMHLDHQTFTLEEEVASALAPLRSLAGEKKIDMQLTFAKDLPQQVVGDPNRLRQILLNLGGNAVKYTEEGQVNITLTCRLTTEKHHTLQLVVEDTGTGMTEETLAKLFLPFYQADDGSVSQSKGTGLGMSITKELVELMKGQIQVDSTLGKGTRVVVQLMVGKVSEHDGCKRAIEMFLLKT